MSAILSPVFDEVFFNGMNKLIIIYFISASFFITVNYFMKWLFKIEDKDKDDRRRND
jgi:hypothetical protein